MVTENVDIRFRETGSRVIRRRIDAIAEAANDASRDVFLLRRAFSTIFVGAGIRALTQQLDLLTNYENRLRLTTTSTANLEAVQRSLFQVSRDTRTSFESVADIYSRTALSVRELGISQQQTLEFTESLAQAAILSGASFREANAALIQLSQGLASGRLNGDELRSVLEQLPFVADVIADELGVTRGELRKLGADGKISAEIVLDAFENARDEIDALFAETIPTIGQALTVAQTNFLRFLDTFDDATGFSAALARSIITLSGSIDDFAAALGAVAIAAGIVFGARALQSLAGYVGQIRAVGIASARFTEIERLRAAAHLNRARAQSIANATEVTNLRQGVAQLTQTQALLRQQQASIVIDNQRRIARDALTGRFIAYNAAIAQNVRTNIALTQTERALTAQRIQLSAATATQTGLTNAYAGAATRSNAAQAASSGLVSRLTQAFPLLAGSIRLVISGLGRLFALLAANPIGAIVVAIATATGALITFGNRIRVGADEAAGLRDVFQATFELIGEQIAPVVRLLRTTFGTAFTFLRNLVINTFTGMLEFILGFVSAVIDSITFIPRVFIGLVAGIRDVWGELPDVARDVGIQFVNFFIEQIEKIPNFFIRITNNIVEIFNGLLSVLGPVAENVFGIAEIEIPTIPPVTLPRIQNDYAGAGAAAADAFQEGFTRGFESLTVDNILAAAATQAGLIYERILSRAVEIARRNLPGGGEEDGVSDVPGVPGGRGGSGDGDLSALQEALKEISESSAAQRIEELQIQQRALNIALESGIVSQREFNLLQAQLRQESAELIFELSSTEQAIRGINLSILELAVNAGQASFADSFLLQLGRMSEGVENFRTSAGTAFGEFFTSFSDGVADSIGAAIFETQDLGEALRNVARQALQQLISQLIKLGLRYVLNATLGRTIAAAATAASAAQASALAAAWAPAAALASLATGGTNAAGANAAILGTIASTRALAAVGNFANGGLINAPGGPRDDLGVARVSNGEFVVNAHATRRNLALLNAINSGGDGVPRVPSSAVSSRGAASQGGGGSTGTVININPVSMVAGVELITRRISETDVEIIAREVAEQVLDENADSVIGRALSNPGSDSSNAIQNNTTAQRRLG